jgi:5-methylcytosine-specific restriction protein B
MIVRLKEKKNVILQGPPGVGKTFFARRLAYSSMGVKDLNRVEMVQFHQSYSYEDFIQGYRPQGKEGFVLKSGIFYDFCRKAQHDQSRDYFFIIDEINRGNMSKVLGEVLMLIETDKRGQEFAIPLTYSSGADERLYIPENLHLIGTMNTADRSLSLVDYALRRRFAFITLTPRFSSEKFVAALKERGASPILIKKIVERSAELNGAISKDARNLGPGYCLGHSYFCQKTLGPLDDNWYRRIIETEIKPLLEEYWIDEPVKVTDHLALLLA